MRERIRAYLLGVELQERPGFANEIEELQGLAEACHIEVVGIWSQKLDYPHRTHYLGAGKLQEVAEALRAAGEELAVIANDELTPSQIRTLERELDCRVLDRTMLILELFALRARTREAQLQVRIAELQYRLPRLAGLRESLGRQGGGSGLINRGSGETKLELDRRKILAQIDSMQGELEKLVHRRQVQRKQRQKRGVPVVALVGYTNAGKSSLLNALLRAYQPESEKQVMAKDMLFATLETSVRRIELPDRQHFLATDTVGFVSRLPHHLVKAFRSTLEELTEADLLIHVVDYANPEHPEQIEVTQETLRELGAEGIPVIYAYNKADQAGVVYPLIEGEGIYLSAREGKGIEELVAMIRERVLEPYMACDITVPFTEGGIVSYFNEHAQIHETRYEPEGTRLRLSCSPADYERYRERVIVHDADAATID
ncbi:GTPase HflX [Paenibacillus sp. 598K]|uniref:GTPase HflX n=1 Tax=Paenibacillus sp. 598K TaxID=1117987 RepID=UPI000FFA1719|nr:GTPase HflX [Paenibacillus sp. 598K]GBF78103.1 GTPase HflX [Paenibacillus sp. 598K]